MKKHLAIASMLALALSLSARTVKVTDFKPDPKDATAALQAAFDSKAETVIVDNPGFVYLSNQLRLKGEQEIVIQDGVVIRAIPGEFKPRSSFLFSAMGIKNLILRGEGNATLLMNKKDYQDQKQYLPSEWRHAIAMWNCQNITIRDLTIASSGGDGIYVAANSKDVLLENLELKDHHRQGISVISAFNLVIRKCRIYGTDGTAPQAGIDFEPNRETDHLVNNLVEDCDIFDNTGSGIDFAFGGLRLLPVGITVRNCRIYGNKSGELDFLTGYQKPGLEKQGTVKIEGCSLVAKYGNAIYFQDPYEAGPVVSFKDTTVDATQLKAPVIQFATKTPDAIVNLDFGNLRIAAAPNATIVNADSLGIAAFKMPKGTITVSQNGKEKPFDFGPIVAEHPGMPQFKNFKPAELDVAGLAPVGKTAENGKPIQIRHQGTLLQYATPDRPVNIKFTIGWTRQPKIPYKLIVFAPDGGQFDQADIGTPTHTYVLKAKAAGVYRLDVRPGDHGVLVTSDAPGFAYAAVAYNGLASFRSHHTVYFEVPADLTEVQLRFSTERGEGMRVELSDENGKVLETTEYFEMLRFISVKRQPTAKPVLWKIRQFKVVEDNATQLGAPIRPILYTHPSQWLR